jgi:predicted nucleic acid-binding Zn ribbon protein
LTIEASDQQWATELKWMTSLLIERCCDALGLDAVTEVRIIRCERLFSAKISGVTGAELLG